MRQIGNNWVKLSSGAGQIRPNLYNFLKLLNEPTAVPYVFQEPAAIDILIRLSISLSIMSIDGLGSDWVVYLLLGKGP